MAADATFEIVVLCTGNRFRSPLSEYLLREAVAGLPVDVSSVGTLELGSVGVLPEALELGREFGLDLAPHRTRALASGRLEHADLVIGFEQKHIAAAVVDGGASRGRTFTLGELAALVRAIDPPREEDPVARARAAVAAADDLRRRVQRDAPLAEVPDPWGATPAVFRRTAESVRTLVGEVVRGLFGARAG